MWDNVLVGAIVGIVAFVVSRSLYRTAAGKDDGGHCGDGAQCRCSGTCATLMKAESKADRQEDARVPIGTHTD
jgi:hypothetical protein